MTIKIKALSDKAIMPTYGSKGAACFDLYATHGGVVPARGSAMFSTDLAFEIPEGYVMKVYSRSSQGFKYGISLVNGTGIIDCVTEDTKITINSSGEAKTIGELLGLLGKEELSCYTLDLNTGKYGVFPIEDIWKVGEKEILEISFDDGSSIKTTKTQLLYPIENGDILETKAQDLKIGDSVLSL